MKGSLKSEEKPEAKLRTSQKRKVLPGFRKMKKLDSQVSIPVTAPISVHNADDDDAFFSQLASRQKSKSLIKKNRMSIDQFEHEL